MKHNVKVTIILVLMFLLSQLVGLHVVATRYNVLDSFESGEAVVNEGDPMKELIGAPPKVGSSLGDRMKVVGFFMLAILGGTLIVLIMAKFKLLKLWKFWFGLSVFFALFSALISYVEKVLGVFGLRALWLTSSICAVIALGFTIVKIFSKNTWPHNITEILIYGGIVSLFVSLFDVLSVFVLLIVISIYDMIAVWQSKHMITLAKFQTDSAIFGGLFIPYDGSKKIKISNEVKKEGSKGGVGILGGGDIAFPLLFAAVVLLKSANIVLALTIVVGSTIALTGLFLMSKKGRYYPAMPFISAGCFAGYFIGIIF